ncbi:MAG: S26 family signal peptidase [Dehalococcoidia bacterium]|nr:S26 family signal peptidase [Dehalococcoidia bacterium]
MTSKRGQSHVRLAPLLAVLAITIELAAFLVWAKYRFIRYEVSGQSMYPAYRHGDWLIADRHAYRRRLPAPSHAVIAPDPTDPTRTLLKRVVRIDLHRQAWLEGDNAAHSRDSRHFGPIPVESIIARARWRYWPVGGHRRHR